MPQMTAKEVRTTEIQAILDSAAEITYAAGALRMQIVITQWLLARNMTVVAEDVINLPLPPYPTPIHPPTPKE